MDKYSSILDHLIITLSFGLLLGCNTKIDSNNDDYTIKRLKADGITFNYKLGDTIEFGENHLININCSVKNTTKNDVNYLCQSCNWLDYYLTIYPPKYEVAPNLCCNVTYPMIGKLTAGDSLKFTTRILKFKNASPIESVGLDFIVVSQYIPFDTLGKHPELIEEIYRAKTHRENVVFAK